MKLPTKLLAFLREDIEQWNKAADTSDALVQHLVGQNQKQLAQARSRAYRERAEEIHSLLKAVNGNGVSAKPTRSAKRR